MASEDMATGYNSKTFFGYSSDAKEGYMQTAKELLGMRIREVRKARQLSQEKLAEKVGVATGFVMMQ